MEQVLYPYLFKNIIRIPYKGVRKRTANYYRLSVENR
jgi:hypothetical protein